MGSCARGFHFNANSRSGFSLNCGSLTRRVPHQSQASKMWGMEWWWIDLPDFRGYILELQGLNFRGILGYHWKFQALLISGPGGVSQKGSRERCLPVVWENETKQKRKQKEKKRRKNGENGQKKRKKKKKINGSDTVPATPFAKFGDSIHQE